MRVKLLLTYDILAGTQEQYYHFMTSELLVWLQQQGLVLTDVWHTMYGDHPMRTIGMVAEDEEHLARILNSDEWEALEDRLLAYVTNYERRIIPFRGGFQI